MSGRNVNKEVQPGTSQSQIGTQSQQLSQPTTEEIQQMVNNTVNYLLIGDQKKLPLKRQDIIKNAMKNHGHIFRKVMEKAAEILKQVYGIGVEQVEGKSGQYMLVNQLELDEENPHLEWKDDVKAQQGLLLIILALIFMNGGSVKEDVLWSVLKKLGVYHEPERKRSSQCQEELEKLMFGDVKKLINQEFVRQLYLECNKMPESEPPKYEYRWGHRAKIEVLRRDVLQFVCQLYKIDKLMDWTTQYQEVLRCEGGGDDQSRDESME